MKQRIRVIASKRIKRLPKETLLHPHRIKPLSFKFSGPDLESSIKEAEDLCEKTLHKLNRQSLNDLIIYNDKLNSPVRYKSSDIQEIVRAGGCFSDKWAKSSPNFQEILKRSRQLADSMIIPLPNLRSNLGDADWEDLMIKTLELMEIKDGSIIRFFIPGNNDQSNPVWVANQIDFVIHYAKSFNIKSLSVQVLILGKGGHASTAIFPQTCVLDRKRVKGKYVEEFKGIPEARSLAYTLDIALRRKGIKPKAVDFIKRDRSNRIKKGGFTLSPPAGFRVEIMQECNSTNTEQNVLAAKLCDLDKNLRPKHIFVTCAVTASIRQALTFAKRYGDNEGYYYKTITDISLPRSLGFIKGLTNRQACVEFYAGIMERCKYYFYSYQRDYIPPSLVDEEELENIFKIYALLAHKSLETSKKEGIENIYNFFQDKFKILEKVIICNIPHKGVLSKEEHLRANQQVSVSMVARDLYQ